MQGEAEGVGEQLLAVALRAQQWHKLCREDPLGDEDPALAEVEAHGARAPGGRDVVDRDVRRAGPAELLHGGEGVDAQAKTLYSQQMIRVRR